jgi:hypothetical protein
MPANAGSSRARAYQAAQYFQGGGFAGGVGSQQGKELASANGERNIVYGDEVTELFRDVVKLQHSP